MVDATSGYRFCDIALAVASDAPAVARWLEEFLRPAFEPWTGPAGVTVRIRTDAAAHAALAATHPGGTVGEEACFALDSQVVTHPAWRAGGRTVLADAKYGALYALDASTAEVIAAPGSPLFRSSVMRVVREVATTRALVSPDCVQLHAAACEAHGRAVLLAGAKGAGKTTLLAYLAASTGARILGNDRAVVERTGGGLLVRGVPTLVSVRPETRTLVPQLGRGITIERPAHLTLAELEAATRNGTAPDVTTRVRLSPPQLARQLGVDLAATSQLAAVVFPVHGVATDDLVIERLPVDVGASMLLASRFGAASDKAVPTVFERLLPRRRATDADAALVKVIAAQVPCFTVRLGAARFGEARAAERILRTVLSESGAA